jgi:hypothetical protein
MKKISLLFLIVVGSTTAKSQQFISMDSIFCNLRDFLILETHLDTALTIEHDCKTTIIMYELLSNESNLSVDFGVFAFASTFISDDFWHYLVKYHDELIIFSAKDPILAINTLLELQEQHPEEVNMDIVVQYIKAIGKRKAIDMGAYLIFQKNIGDLKYIYPSHRYK